MSLHHGATEARSRLIHEELTNVIIGAAIEVHRELGPGLLESAYEECLCHEFNLRGLKFARQVAVPVTYKSINLDCGYRLDLLVEDPAVAVDVRLGDVHRVVERPSDAGEPAAERV